ncbi:MAG: methyltransferase domain-containing protein [Candidatus Campbellbacteria bacterium]|nr:methyltransferase domain-containing protein [Candidatus Campbellbacteria bacterium]
MLNWRKKLVAELTGDVLEIGVGAGQNIPLYTHASSVAGIEPNYEQYQKAVKVAGGVKIPVSITHISAENLPFSNGSFDHVVSSLVLCSVSNQKKVLNEIERVLRPGGVLHMVEHIRPSNTCLRYIADRATPRWSAFAYNCHLNRPTLETLQESGWSVVIDWKMGFIIRAHATPRRITSSAPTPN